MLRKVPGKLLVHLGVQTALAGTAPLSVVGGCPHRIKHDRPALDVRQPKDGYQDPILFPPFPKSETNKQSRLDLVLSVTKV